MQRLKREKNGQTIYPCNNGSDYVVTNAHAGDKQQFGTQLCLVHRPTSASLPTWTTRPTSKTKQNLFYTCSSWGQFHQQTYPQLLRTQMLLCLTSISSTDLRSPLFINLSLCPTFTLYTLCHEP